MLLLLLTLACLDPSASSGEREPFEDSGGDAESEDTNTDPVDTDTPTDPAPPAGSPDTQLACPVPAAGAEVDTSSPDTVVGDGTAASCTSKAVVDAVAAGGVITFDCGPDPVTIELDETARVFNNTGPDIVIDGGGKVTLSGRGQRRILYMNTCDQAQVWTTSHCQDQDHPRLTVQNLTFVDGDATSEGDGGGAIFARGGQLRIVNSRFFRNRCTEEGPDVGGGAVRAFDQFEDRPLHVTGSTFGGAAGYGNGGSNGGAISSIGVSWTLTNSWFSHNEAVGNGGNPAQPNTPGGGSGGAVYNDGRTMTLALCGTRIEHNTVVQHGSAIFFVSNDHTGDVAIENSVITANTGGTWYPTYPQISGHADTPIVVVNSVIQ